MTSQHTHFYRYESVKILKPHRRHTPINTCFQSRLPFALPYEKVKQVKVSRVMGIMPFTERLKGVPKRRV